ncbi:ATP-binding protein [Streptomyces sp. QHH-9511]|uniref:ATP-binding protein n=2 Tax=Streptomyces TaxID=1883 RepID=UPI00227D79C9|nr:ATP-binding protein [Streptomyces sp. QHH-9511]
MAFTKRPEAVAQARETTRTFMSTLHPAVDAQAAASVELVVSELVTNAVRHARGAAGSLCLQARADSITVDVMDADPRPPRERTPDLTGGTGGFGWPMVRNLATAVAVTTGTSGKTVRAVLPR